MLSDFETPLKSQVLVKILWETLPKNSFESNTKTTIKTSKDILFQKNHQMLHITKKIPFHIFSEKTFNTKQFSLDPPTVI